MGYEGGNYRRGRGQYYGARDDYRDRSARRYEGRPSGYDSDDRGFFDRAGDEVRSWFGDEEAERRRRQDDLEYERIHGRSDQRWQSAYGSDYGGYGVGGYVGRPAGGYDSGGYSYRDAGADLSRSYAPYRGDTYRESSSDRHDPNYHAWRSREIAALDRDYDEYRRENQARFDNDFGSWRTTRSGQRRQLQDVREHQEVVGSDGSHVGTVDHVRGDRILLTKNDSNAGGHHHSVPCSWVNAISDKVELNRTAAEATQAWRDEERRAAIGGYGDSDGPHILNKSFAGTY